jgi:hypothetical protein
MSPIDFDYSDEAADWIKGGYWDVPAGSLEELRAWLKSVGMTAAQFKRLRAYKANVGRLPWLRDL